MARIDVEYKEFENLQQAMLNYPGNTEKAINDIFHNEAPLLVEQEIIRLMPVSGRKWNGKKAPAKTSKSLIQKTDENLSFTVGTKYNYHYLYFPDDGSNTRHHAGNQQFFKRSGENKQEEIIKRCVTRLTEDFGNI